MFDNLIHGDFLHVFIEYMTHSYIYICNTYTHTHIYIYISMYIFTQSININILRSAEYSENSIEKFMNEF